MRNYDILTASEQAKPEWKIFWRKDINKQNGKVKRRRLCVPIGKIMKEIQGVLKNRVRGLSGEMPSATGFRKRVSIVDSICRHKSRFGKKMVFNRFVITIDIKNAYRTVKADDLAWVLGQINPKQFSGYQRTIKFVEQFCFDPEFGGLAMGAPASNDLFNVYCEYTLDVRLRGICDVYNITYTRYVDDLMFSSQNQITEPVRKLIRETMESAGFVINDKKAHVYDLRLGPIQVNGVGITYEGKMFLPRKTLTKLRGMIHCARRGMPVSIYKIDGYMSLFKSRSNLEELNSTERKVLEAYNELHANLKSGKVENSDQNDEALDYDDYGICE
jgi:hypothetical protein